jgi:rod shape-determining protein MreC
VAYTWALVPRNRTVRVAVLGSSVQRAASSGYSSTRSGAVKRRIVVGVLVLLSLVLITLSFRSSALDPVESAGASALRPFEVGANRVAQPFRDAVGWTRGVFHAKSENRRLHRDVEQLRRQVNEEQAALAENSLLRRELAFRDSPSFPKDYYAVVTRVLTNPAASYDQTVTVDAGSSAGVAVQDVVVTEDGLVGQVTKVTAHVSKVMLITDPDSAVRAIDATHRTAIGILQHGSTSNALVLARVTKDKKVEAGDTIVTAGSPGTGELPSLYPRNILIGKVSSVGQNDVDLFKQIQVQPFVDLTSLQSVIVLVPKERKPPAP